MKPYEGTKPYIFISYAHKNKDKVMSIIKRMNIDGYRIWFDEGIEPGNEWADNIAYEILNSTCLIAMISREYVESENCKDEISYARENNVKVLLLYLEDIQLSGGLALRNHRMQSFFQFKYTDQNVFYDKLYAVSILCKCKNDINDNGNAASELCDDKAIDTKELQLLVEKGDANAAYKLAKLYKYGKYHVEDKKRAFELYMIAAETGSVEALYELSRCYEYGLGVKKDKERGMELLTEAAHKDSVNALRSLALVYEHGEGKKKNAQEAIKLYIRAYELGDYKVASDLGRIYYFGVNGEINTDTAQAAYWFELSVAAGVLDDANYLGDICRYGKDYENAAKWYKIGADEDVMGMAQYELGMMYLRGEGVVQDKEEGIKWLIKSAEKESTPLAAAELGKIYEEGEGVEQNKQKAKEWYEKAAESKFSLIWPEILVKSKKGRIRLLTYTLEKIGWIIVVLVGVGIIIGLISHEIKNIQNNSEKQEEDVQQDLEEITFGALTYKVDSKWKYQLDYEGEGITYYPDEKKEWPYIYIYRISYPLEGNRDTMYSDYANLLDLSTDEYTDKTKVIVDDNRAYCIVDTIQFKGKEYDFCSYYILRNDILYVINCSEETPMSGEFKEIYSEFIANIKFESVYSNDPCPCGSGTKYKYCCGIE